MGSGALFTWTSGWLLAVLVATTVVLPYYLRRERVEKRMWPHILCGSLVAPIAFIHPWPAMSHGWVKNSNVTGLYLASLALLLAFVQIVVGLLLRQSTGAAARWIRRLHLTVMSGIVLLTVGHVALNSPTLRVLFP
jgi:hypothetical protein